MDFIKKAADSLGKDNKSTENKPADGQAGQKDDYGDKAFAFAASKSGHNIDRNTQEKITDGAREQYEKMTGNKVSDKFSN